MKRIICLILALTAMISMCLSLASCSKVDEVAIDAAMDYYVERLEKDIERRDIKVVEYDEKTNTSELFIENKELDISQTLIVEGAMKMYTVYTRDGERLHIYNGNRSDEE